MELQASELRIGNYVNNLFSDRNYSTIDGFDSEYIYLDEITIDYIEHKDVEPIPLTEEWLVRFNYFKILDDLFHHTLKSKKIDHAVHEKDGKFYSDGLHEKEIKYVHILQNVYRFDVLTGEELTIKE